MFKLKRLSVERVPQETFLFCKSYYDNGKLHEVFFLTDNESLELATWIRRECNYKLKLSQVSVERVYEDGGGPYLQFCILITDSAFSGFSLEIEEGKQLADWICKTAL